MVAGSDQSGSSPVGGVGTRGRCGILADSFRVVLCAGQAERPCLHPSTSTAGRPAWPAVGVPRAGGRSSTPSRTPYSAPRNRRIGLMLSPVSPVKAPVVVGGAPGDNISPILLFL